MKKIVSMLIGLSLVLGTCAFAQAPAGEKKEEAKKSKKGKKGAKKEDKKEEKK